MLDVDIKVPRREFDIAVNFCVGAGERFALFGPSGSGKTTILEAIAGLVSSVEGHIALDGRTLTVAGARRRRAVGVPVWDRRVALLRQDPCLFPHLSVKENIAYASVRRDPVAIDRLVKLLQIEDLLAASPGKVSGGQGQRIGLARALAAEHGCLLLDEPYSGLDAPLRRELTMIVAAETRARQVPAVLVAHELEEAQAFADRLGVIDRGRLVQVGTPAEVVRHPASRRVAELVGYRSFIPLALSPGPGPIRDLVAGVHPERVHLGTHPAAGHVVKGCVLAARPAGAGWELDVQVSGATVTLRADDNPHQVGAELELTLVDPPLFDRGGQAVAPQQQVIGA